MNFKSKTVLITGAAHGIGKSFAKLFYKRGARIVLIDIDGDELKKVFTEITGNNGQHICLIKDLASHKERQAIFDELQSKNIEVDILVNNIGIGYRGYVTDTPWEKLERVIDVNVKGTTHLTWLFLPQMKKRKSGGIINLSSTGAFLGANVGSVYTGTKAYVTNFTEGLSMELYGTGVQAMAAHPGATDTKFWEASGWANSEYNMKIKKMAPDDTAEEFIEAFNKKKAFVIAGSRNRRMVFMSKFIPREILKKMAIKKYE